MASTKNIKINMFLVASNWCAVGKRFKDFPLYFLRCMLKELSQAFQNCNCDSFTGGGSICLRLVLRGGRFWMCHCLLGYG